MCPPSRGWRTPSISRPRPSPPPPTPAQTGSPSRCPRNRQVFCISATGASPLHLSYLWNLCSTSVSGNSLTNCVPLKRCICGVDNIMVINIAEYLLQNLHRKFHHSDNILITVNDHCNCCTESILQVNCPKILKISQIIQILY